MHRGVVALGVVFLAASGIGVLSALHERLTNIPLGAGALLCGSLSLSYTRRLLRGEA